MKKIFMFILLGMIFPLSAISQESNSLPEISLVGISDAYAGVRRYCNKTTGEQLVSLNNFIIRSNGALTAYSLISNCQYYLNETDDICSGGDLVVDKNIPANVQCQAYIGTALFTHNKLVDKLQKPGTYVMPYNGTGMLGNNRGVYSIVGVVPGDSNKIYNIAQDGSVSELPFETRTPNMFINIDTNDDVIGVHNHSVIYTQVDMTFAVVKMIEQKTGGYVFNSIGLKSQGDLDIKNSIGVELYQTPEQKKDLTYGATYAHTNGVLFQGKVVNFEWLGHYIFGARKGSDDNILEDLYDVMADNEQARTSAKTAGQSQTDSDMHKDVAQNAYVEWAEDASGKTTRERFIARRHIDFFKNKETNTELEAYALAEDYIKTVLGNVSNIECYGVAESMGNDMVTCQWATNSNETGITIFEFDDIGNGKEYTLYVDDVEPFLSVQTKTVYEAIEKAKNYVRKKHGIVQNLSCDGNCNLLGNDTVRCIFKKGDTLYKQNFRFDDICD